MAINDCGIVLAAHGQKYIEEGKPLVKSIRQHMPWIEITLLTDYDTFVPSDWVDNVRRIDTSIYDNNSVEVQAAISSSAEAAPKLKGWLFKVWAMSYTPYQRSLFLDMDTILGHPVNDIFHLLGKYDIAVGYAPTKVKASVGSTPIDDLKKHAAIPRISTGVVGFSHRAVDNHFLLSWEQRLLNGIKRGHHLARPNYGDQSEFRPLIWENPSTVFLMPNEYHLRAGNTSTLDGPVRILHGRPRGGRERLINFLNSTHEKRIWHHGEGMRVVSDGYSEVLPYDYQNNKLQMLAS